MEDNGNLQLYQAGYYRYDTFTKLELLPVFSFKSMMHCSLFYFLAAVYYDNNCLVNDQNGYYQSSVSICSLFI